MSPLGLRQCTADVAEYRVYCCGYVPDAGNGCEGNQADQQCVFDQILTFVAGCQILQPDTQRKKYVIHLSHHLLFLRMSDFISRAQSPVRDPRLAFTFFPVFSIQKSARIQNKKADLFPTTFMS